MSESVLIVDDSLTVRMDLAEAFSAAGFRVVPCASGAEARAAWDRERPDVAVLDVLLPDADGIELSRELSRDPETSPVILILSTEVEIADRSRGLSTGADEYVGKPYDARYVVGRARELLRRKRGLEQDTKPILLIDDSATFRNELGRRLEAAGYDVLFAESGEEGLRVAADRRPSAIIVDGVLPGMDGPAVIRRIRLDPALRATACVLLTGSGGQGAELAALDAGADAFVTKDEDDGVVLAKVAAVLRRVAAERALQPAASSLGAKRVLAVDDSATYLHEIGEILRDDGYDVICARSGEEALDLLALQPVDCVLLDLIMPGMGGHETCKRIKSAPVVRDIPVILLTSLDDRDAMLRGLAAGADDYISKSNEVDVLRARVRAQIRRKVFEDENRNIREQLLRKDFEAAEARAAQELAELRAAMVEELQLKNEELEAFSYSVSHDLRAPLRSIDGFSQALLEDYGGELDARGQDYLKRVRTAAQRMGELIDDLLELSRVSRTELARGRVNLAELAHAVVGAIREREPERHVTVEIADELWADADRRLMTAVLENLLGNAWKFTGRAAEPRIELFMDRGGSTHAYVVRDNGAGFNMKHVDKLFKPFQRLHGVADYPGTGIGLATVRRIVERHGGRVWASAEPGRGASFFFTLGARK